MTAPMFTIAPIMMTALSPMDTRSRMIAPGSMRAFTSLRSKSGTAELRQSFSMSKCSIASALASSRAETSDQSPKTTRPSGEPYTRNDPHSIVAPGFSRMYTFTGVFLGAEAMKSMIS